MGFLSVDNLIRLVRSGFEKIREHRASNASISLGDALMAAFAMFSLKDSSLLEFDERRAKDGNLKQIYGLEDVPSDTQMRKILDPVSPDEIKPLYKDVFGQLERGKGLEGMVYFGKYYLVSVDGTGYFSSKKIHCDACSTRKNSKTGEISILSKKQGRS